MTHSFSDTWGIVPGGLRTTPPQPRLRGTQSLQYGRPTAVLPCKKR